MDQRSLRPKPNAQPKGRAIDPKQLGRTSDLVEWSMSRRTSDEARSNPSESRGALPNRIAIEANHNHVRRPVERNGNHGQSRADPARDRTPSAGPGLRAATRPRRLHPTESQLLLGLSSLHGTCKRAQSGPARQKGALDFAKSELIFDFKIFLKSFFFARAPLRSAASLGSTENAQRSHSGLHRD